jgi:WD40 repeat protein/uncharacterized caspase-like protein
MRSFIILFCLALVIETVSGQEPKLVLPIGHTSSISDAVFSPDGEMVATASWDNTAKVWDVRTGALLQDLRGHDGAITTIAFSPDGKKVATGSEDKKVMLWDLTGADPATEFNEISSISNLVFSPDGLRMAIGTVNALSIWNLSTRMKEQRISSFYGEMNVAFSNDSKRILVIDHSNFQVFDAANGEQVFEVEIQKGTVTASDLSLDGFLIVAGGSDLTVKIWNTSTGSLLATMPNQKKDITGVLFSPDSKSLIINSLDGSVALLDVKTGNLIRQIRPDGGPITYIKFSKDGRRLLCSGDSKIAEVWNLETGQLQFKLEGHDDHITALGFSLTDKYIVTASKDRTAIIWEGGSGKLYQKLQGHTRGLASMTFSSSENKLTPVAKPDPQSEFGNASITLVRYIESLGPRLEAFAFSPGKKQVVLATGSSVAEVWDYGNGRILHQLRGHSNAITSVAFSPDGKTILTGSWDQTARLWDASSGHLLKIFNGHKAGLSTVTYSSDGSKIATGARDNTAMIWNLATGAMISKLTGHTDVLTSLSFSSDGKKINTVSDDQTAKVWEISGSRLLYTYILIDSSDNLVFDSKGHYDGTQGGRNLLYFVCGGEVIKLQQLKDKFWVPGLVERINRGESLGSATLAGLNICGLLPQTVQQEDDLGYHFKITPRRGGVGSVALKINDILYKQYLPAQLRKERDQFILDITKAELLPYFRSDVSNKLQVTAYTSSNDISSRGVEVQSLPAHNAAVPNLHAVFIGISDYKGDDLKLKYAAKDAEDISRALGASSSKLLGADHVFTYRIHTGTDRTSFPDKASIRSTFEAIGKKSGPNDILLVFFAGHGIVQGSDKQFYFLTADASRSLINDNDVKNIGISAAELMDWMKPTSIKAQKRVLILDACHSGQAINQMVAIGSRDQGYIASRNDDRAAEIRQIDKLNERAGLYVLAASASNQSAYEMSRYNQGLLTYALLKVLKEQPSILEDNKYLNVSGWFNAAQKLVTDIVRESGLRQEPQLITTTNFNIGIIDKDVLAQIVLPVEKPLFAASAFSDRTNDDDSLQLSRQLNEQLNLTASRDGGGPIAYLASSSSPEAYTLRGGYEIKNDEVFVNVIIKQGLSTRGRFEIRGKLSDINSLVRNILDRAIAVIAGGS